MNNYELRLKLNYAKLVSEPVIRMAYECDGYNVKESSIAEDYSGIDFTLEGKDLNEPTPYDGKCPEFKNINSSNFLYTINDSLGRSYKCKKTKNVSFLDVAYNRIVSIDMNNLTELIDNATPLQSKRHPLSRYVLLNKEIVVRKSNKVLKNDNIQKMYYEKRESFRRAFPAISQGTFESL